MSSTKSIRPWPEPAHLDTSPRPAGLLAALQTLWRRRLILVGVIVLVAATVGIGLSLAERSYTAQTRVAVVPGETGPTGTEYEKMQRTVADVAASRPVLSSVQQELGDLSLTELRQQVKSGVVSGTLLVQISATDSDPRRAAEIANAVANQLQANDPSNETVEYEVTDPAAPPQSAASPNVPVTVLAAAALAVALAIATALAYDRLARTVDTAEDVTDTGVQVLGSIGSSRLLDDLAANDPASTQFSNVRALRVALELGGVAEQTRTVVVAGAASDVRSSWVGVNLAAALAGVGHRVLLIDADRSGAARHSAFDGPAENEWSAAHAGLYDVLDADATLGEVIRPGPVDGVDVVGLGAAHRAEPNLLEMRFQEVVAAASEAPNSKGASHDVIVACTAPVTESDDARVMALDGGVLLTIPEGQLKPAALQSAVQSLRSARTRVLGAVLMDAR